jgi:hypothetical protein
VEVEEEEEADSVAMGDPGTVSKGKEEDLLSLVAGLAHSTEVQMEGVQVDVTEDLHEDGISIMETAPVDVAVKCLAVTGTVGNFFIRGCIYER